MKVPSRWLAEYVDIDVTERSVQQLANQLTLAGIEVEGIIPTGALRGAVVGRVVSHRPHPNSDHLVLCVVDTGTGQAQIICGALNVVDGATVPVIMVGGKLPDGLVIEERKIRGITSQGMICSRTELGLEEHSAGIWNFDPRLNLSLGVDLAELLEFEDYILDISVTSNRPDCLGIYGIAREVAAITGKELHPPLLTFDESSPPTGEQFSVEVEDAADTPRYTASLMSNVTVGSAPPLMQHRLSKAGMRPLANIIDVTNYVMLELGHPLHAFDADLVKDKIIVRHAKKGDSFCTLDKVERKLGPEILMISDPVGDLAIAGVMGGERSEIRKETTNVLLEAATFSPAIIRKTTRFLGLRSEASQRFERGVDPESVPIAAKRVAHLLQKMTGCCVHRGMVDVYPRKRALRTLTLRPSYITSLLGIEIKHAEMAEILTRLGMKVSKKGDNLLAQVPSFRPDLNREVDLIEEIGRIYGYNRLPSTPPETTLQIGKKPPMELYKDQIRAILTGLGLDEAVTDGFDKRQYREALALPVENLVEIKNPMTVGQRALRGSLLPGLLSVVETNLKRGIAGGMLFEVGRVFSKPRNEHESLAGLLFGRTALPLSGRRNIDLLAAKGVIQNLLASLNVGEPRFLTNDIPTFLHPGRAARITLAGEEMGLLGELAPTVCDDLSSSATLILFEIDIDKLQRLGRTKHLFTPPGRFPASKRDLSLLAPIKLPEEKIRQAITSEKLIDSVLLYDLYQGEQVSEHEKSLTYEISLRAGDHTLTDQEVDRSVHRIMKRLAKLDARLRE